jgi:hypothetical protein
MGNVDDLGSYGDPLPFQFHTLVVLKEVWTSILVRTGPSLPDLRFYGNGAECLAGRFTSFPKRSSGGGNPLKTEG